MRQNAVLGRYAPVPGNPRASYIFAVSKTMVVGVALVLNKQDCFK